MRPPVLKMWALIASRPPHSMMVSARSSVDVAWKFVVKCTSRQGTAVAPVDSSLAGHWIHIGWMSEAPRNPLIAVRAWSLTGVSRSRAEVTKWKSASFSASHSEGGVPHRSEEHTSELQSHSDLVCRLLLEK